MPEESRYFRIIFCVHL